MSFTHLQASAQLTATPPTMALSLPNRASTQGTLLVATVAVGDTAGAILAPGPRPMVMGATVGAQNYPGQAEAQAIITFNGFLKRPMASNVQKLYMNEGQKASSLPGGDMLDQIGGGAFILLSARPCRTAGNTYADATVCTNGNTCLQEQANLTAVLTNFLNAGLTTANFKVILWQEPNNSSGFDTAGHFLNYLTYYAPAVRALGLTLCYNPLIGFGGNWNAITGYPGDSFVDELYADYYGSAYGVSSGPPANSLDGTGTNDAGSFVALADNHSGGPIPFGLGEFNAGAGGGPIGTAQWNAYMGYLQNLLTSRIAAGKPMGWNIFWMGNNATPANGGNGQDQVLSATDFKIPALQAMYDAVCAGGTLPVTPGGWQQGAYLTTTRGTLAQFYYADNPGGLYGPANPALFTWTGPTNDRLRGTITELDPPGSTTVTRLDTFGTVTGTGYGTSVPVATSAGAFNGDVAILSEAHFFASNITATSLTVPPGYTNTAQLKTNTPVAWGQSENLSVSSPGAAGVQSVTGGLNYTGPVASNGWAGALCVYRALTAAPISIVGAEPTNCISLDPSGTTLMVGGDVEGCWRSSNFGDNWVPANYGFSSAEDTSFADMKHSLIEPGVVYACNGKTSSSSTGFVASADGGATWSLRSGALNFWTNGTPSPPRPSGNNQDTDRTVNQIIAQDTSRSLLYAVTTNLGVVRSADFGNTWTSIGLSGSAFALRCIAINPANQSEIWVGAWDTGNGNGGVWHCTNANATSPSFTQLGGFTGTIACMQVLGTGSSAYVYYACTSKGLYRSQVSGAANLAQISSAGTGPAIDTTNSLWVTIDGYVDASGNHVLVAGCSNGIKAAGNANYTNILALTYAGTTGPPAITDLTGPSTIYKNAIPPFGLHWWHFGASWQFWLGGNNSVNPQVLIDPATIGGSFSNVHIYLCNSGGFFRTLNGGSTWTLAVNGMPMIGQKTFTMDPANGNHFVTGGSDFTSLDVTGDLTGNTPAGVSITGPGAPLGGAHRESHASDIDATDGRVYVGLNTAYDAPTGGGVTYRASTSPGGPWTDTGYSKFFAPANIANAPACIGVYADHDNNGNRFVVAVAQGKGTYRWDGTSWAAVGQTDSAPMPGSNGAVNQRVCIISGNNHANLFLFDMTQGLYRSHDYGLTWTQIWTKTTSNGQSGFLAFNPNGSGELWISAGDGLWRMTGANSGVVGGTGGPVVTNIGAPFGGGCAGVAFSPASGALYALALPGGAGGVTTLWVSFNDGGSWTDATGGDASIASCGVPANELGISPAGIMWGTNGERFGFYVQLGAAANAASLSGTGSMTAQSSATHGAALSGTGTLTANGFPSSRSAALAATATAVAVATFGATRQVSAAMSGAGFMDAEQAVITSSSIVPQYQGEQLILASDANDWFTWSIAYKADPLGRTVAGLVPDTDLNLSVDAGGSYEVRLAVAWDGPTGTGFGYNWSYPGDATFFMIRWRYANGALGSVADLGNSNRSADTTSGSQKQVLWGYGNYQGGQTGGTLSFQWAPNQNTSSPVTLLAGSLMMIRRIS